MTGGEYPTLSGEGAARLSASAARIVVVGAGGWLGLATLEALHGLLGAAFSERVACFGSSGRTLALRGGLTVPQQPLGRIGDLPSAPTLVLHLAFLTQEKAKAMSDADYIAANGMISSRVLAALDAMGAQAVFVPSSGAAYLVEDRDAAASMRLYGRLKLKDEVRFRRWADSRGRRATIARVFNLSGPYINKRSSYALACFIADALADRPIVIKARRPVLRSYAAVRELMSVVFGLLTGVAEAPAPFDTAGDRDYEMAEIAAVVQEVVGHRRGIERPPLEAGKPDRYLGDGSVYRRLRDGLGVTPADFPAQVWETAKYMAETPSIF